MGCRKPVNRSEKAFKLNCSPHMFPGVYENIGNLGAKKVSLITRVLSLSSSVQAVRITANANIANVVFIKIFITAKTGANEPKDRRCPIYTL